jgi:hypothetical protein
VSSRIVKSIKHDTWLLLLSREEHFATTHVSISSICLKADADALQICHLKRERESRIADWK